MQRPRHHAAGFSLVEILVVIVILAVLAAIAIPVFLRHQENGYRAQAQSAVKNAATAIEGYAARTEGDFSGLDGAGDAALTASGYRAGADVTVTVEADRNNFCVTANHARLGENWKYVSAAGRPQPGACADENG